MAYDRRSAERAHLAFGGGYGPKGSCRVCGRVVAPPRRTFCSAECVTRHRQATSAAEMRAAVEGRDHGVCALCGTDTRQVAATLRCARRDWKDASAAAWAAYRSAPDSSPPDLDGTFRASAFFRAALAVHGWELGDVAGEAAHLWEADHAVALVEGGLNVIENVRTLCLRCHRRETAALAARRALGDRLAASARCPRCSGPVEVGERRERRLLLRCPADAAAFLLLLPEAAR